MQNNVEGRDGIDASVFAWNYMLLRFLPFWQAWLYSSLSNDVTIQVINKY